MIKSLLVNNKSIVDPDDEFGEPTGSERRPVLVRNILEVGDNIAKLSEHELCKTSKGFYAVDNILAELAYNSAPQTKGHEWLSAENEPLLNRIIDDLSLIDIDIDNSTAWQKLKADIKLLREEEAAKGSKNRHRPPSDANI